MLARLVPTTRVSFCGGLDCPSWLVRLTVNCLAMTCQSAVPFWPGTVVRRPAFVVIQALLVGTAGPALLGMLPGPGPVGKITFPDWFTSSTRYGP